ncbi:MAG TPA: hypothetical protein VMS73_02770 [Anaerolineaceae bacterium]|nr:hypothetical protein [Anaerolineaceae bacterium]
MENWKTEDLRVAIYSQNGLGFGQLQRACSIARQIQRARAEAPGLAFWQAAPRGSRRGLWRS